MPLFTVVADWLATAIVAVVWALIRHRKFILFTLAGIALFVGWRVLHLHPQVDQALVFAVLVLPILFGLSIEVVPKRVRENPYYRLAVVLFGIMLTALIWFQMSRANTLAKRERESVIQETAAATASRVTGVLNEQYGSVMSGLYHEIGQLEAKLQGQNNLQKQELALNYVPSVDLVYAGDRLQVWNRGKTNITFSGDKYDGDRGDTSGSGVVISPATSYYLLTDRLRTYILAHIGSNGEDRVPLELYISTADNQKYIVHEELWEVVKDGQITIHTQNRGIEHKDWSKRQ